MVETVQEVLPIARGYSYTLQIRVTGDEPMFPAGCELAAEVRPFAGSTTLAGTLGTADGSIVRIDDDTVELRMPSALTRKIGNASASLDLVRLDPSPDQWLGVKVTLPVVKPVTAPGPDA